MGGTTACTDCDLHRCFRIFFSTFLSFLVKLFRWFIAIFWAVLLWMDLWICSCDSFIVTHLLKRLISKPCLWHSCLVKHTCFILESVSVRDFVRVFLSRRFFGSNSAVLENMWLTKLFSRTRLCQKNHMIHFSTNHKDGFCHQGCPKVFIQFTMTLSSRCCPQWNPMTFIPFIKFKMFEWNVIFSSLGSLSPRCYLIFVLNLCDIAVR